MHPVEAVIISHTKALLLPGHVNNNNILWRRAIKPSNYCNTSWLLSTRKMIQIAYRLSHQLANNKQQGACRSPNNCILDMDDLDMSHVICDIADPMGPWKAKSHFLCTISSQAKVLSYDNGHPPRFNAPGYGKAGVSLHGQAEATAMATMMGRYAITKGRMFKE